MEAIKYFSSLDELKKACINFNADLLNVKFLQNKETNLFYDELAFCPLLYIVICNEKTIIGILKQSVINTFIKDEPSLRFINYVSVNKNYQGKGYAKLLLKEYFSFLSKNNIKKLNLSPYSKQGFSYLKHVIEQLGKEFNIKLSENYCYEY